MTVEALPYNEWTPFINERIMCRSTLNDQRTVKLTIDSSTVQQNNLFLYRQFCVSKDGYECKNAVLSNKTFSRNCAHWKNLKLGCCNEIDEWLVWH